MGNTFGTSRQQVKLVDPREIRTNRVRFGRAAVRDLALANSLYVPGGKLPVRGWILLTRKDYDLVSDGSARYGSNFQLTIDQFDSTAAALTFSNLSIVQARCVSTGLSASQEAIYLVELTDARGILCNQWFQHPTTSYYNVLSPSYPGQYYTNSMKLGVSVWSWSQMVENLWLQLSVLGAYPGLPGGLTGVPVNWNLPGAPAWPALCAMLDHLGLGVSCDLTNAAPYGIVSLGADDAAFDAIAAKYAGRIQDDLEWIDAGAGRVPGSVIVYFRKVYQQYGTEETIRRDSQQWATGVVYSVVVNAPSDFDGATGVHGMWDEFPVRVDVNGVPIAADVTQAAAIAAERVQQYFDLIYSRTSGYLNRVYTGVLPFYAGSQVDGVCWQQDFRSPKRAGWTTTILRGDVAENWPEVYPHG